MVGVGWEQTDSFSRLLAAVKLSQISHGGSGISPLAYQRLLERLNAPDESPVIGNWTASYGAGDVVPAAWFVHSLFDGASENEILAGDVMALINGHFVSTAVGIIAIVDTIRESLRILCALSTLGKTPFSDSKSMTVQLASQLSREGAAPMHGGCRQLPVSLRDVTPYFDEIVASFQGVLKALEKRLSKTSCNPLFVNGGSKAVSQNSYLDFRLTSAMSVLVQSQFVLVSLAQRIIYHVTNRKSVDSPVETDVQPAKVANALIEEMSLGNSQLQRFGGSDSEGIEDMRDLSLLVSTRVLRNNRYIRRMSSLIGSVSGGLIDISADDRLALLRAVGLQCMTESDLAIFEEEASRFTRLS